MECEFAMLSYSRAFTYCVSTVKCDVADPRVGRAGTLDKGLAQGLVS